MSSAIAQTGLSRAALTGQTVIVTGAGRGIGREATRAFAWLGARVVVAEISTEGQETAQVIADEGGTALFVRTDVADETSVAALVEQTHAAFGPVDVLVNNAILCPVASSAEMDVALWDRVIAVNLRGTFLTCRAFLPDMLTRGRGVIVNMVSTDAMPGLAAYIASKQGIVGFTQSLALEIEGRGVRVVAFGPGMVDTPAIRAVAPDLAPRLGMTPEQFLSAPLHPAYEGLMPAEHAGAATAYLAAALADEYHGEVVTGYTVLERAGVIAAPGAPSAPTPVAPVSATADGQQGLVLARQLCDVIADTEAEFGQLPVFIRPMARNGFKNKAGQSIQDWRRTAGSLAERWQQVAAGNVAATAALHGERERLRALLGQLRTYYNGVPAETARFSKDPVFLSKIAQITAKRVALIDALLAALEAM